MVVRVGAHSLTLFRLCRFSLGDDEPPMRRFRETVGWSVDRLPLWLWHDGNLYDVPGGTLHFCVDHAEGPDDRSVRTIEFARTSRPSRTIARGLQQFPFDHPDLHEFEKDEVHWGLISTWRSHRRHMKGGPGGATA
jgi:hypothetical protein